jgi:hypothetical protein
MIMKLKKSEARAQGAVEPVKINYDRVKFRVNFLSLRVEKTVSRSGR